MISNFNGNLQWMISYTYRLKRLLWFVMINRMEWVEFRDWKVFDEMRKWTVKIKMWFYKLWVEMKRKSSYEQLQTIEERYNYFTVPIICKLFCFWGIVDFTIIAFGRFVCWFESYTTHSCWCLFLFTESSQ
jgi:hypothetical protein